MTSVMSITGERHLMPKEGACVHQVRCSSGTSRPDRAVGDFDAPVDGAATLEARSVPTAFTAGSSLAPRATAQSL